MKIERVTPAWSRRLDQAADSQISFEDLRDIYVYLRSTRGLIERSSIAKKIRHWYVVECKMQYVFSKEGFGNRTRIREIIKELTERGVGPEVSYIEKKSMVGMIKPRHEQSEEEEKTKEYLQEGGRLNRASNWQWRLQAAITEAIRKDWYPLFGTYTVDPKRLPEGCLTRDDLWTDKKAGHWDRFVKKYKTEVADACGMGRRPSKWKKTSDWFQYMAVLEHGKTGKHPHIHVIWLCKKIPKNWRTDPNRNCSENTEVDIPAASALWEHGNQRKTMALFIVGSPFIDELKWEVPINEKTGKRRKVAGPGSVAGYIGKYLTKGVTKQWDHRVKSTKSLGLMKLARQLSEVKSLSLLLGLSSRPMQYKMWMKIQQATSCPMSLIREKSKKELVRRYHSMKTPQGKNLLRMEWTKNKQEFYTTLMYSVRAGIRIWKMTRERRYNFFTQILEEVESTVHSDAIILKLLEWLCDNDPNEKSSVPFEPLKGVFA